MNNSICLLLVDNMPKNRFIERVQKSPAAAPFRIVVPKTESEEDFLALAPEAEAIFCYKAPVPGSLIRAAKSLKIIQKFGVNCRNIDVSTATECGVAVATQQPLLWSASVAEEALALMLACVRKVIPGHRAVVDAVYREMGLEPIRTSQWKIRANWPGIKGVTELFQAAVGIVGFGDIGMEIAKRCRAFEMKVYYYDGLRYPEEAEKAHAVSYLPLDELLAVSDYVVLSLPHNPQSEGLIGAREIARMKSSATLINVARGPLVDEDALAEALQSRRIAMAGLDVYRMEPLPESSPLRKLDNVVLLPHLGGGSNRCWDIDIPACLENIHRFFKGEPAHGIFNRGERD